MNDLLQQAQFHAARCEHYSRMSDRLPVHCGWAETIARASHAQLANFHALKAFELSAQAAQGARA